MAFCYSANSSQKHAKTTSSSSSSSWLSPVVLCILWTETAERFAYFGFRAILVLYFTLSLHFSEANSIALYAYMTSLAYLTPLLGALLADGTWGCYPTILWFGVIYAVGLMMVTYGASLGEDATTTVITHAAATVTSSSTTTSTTPSSSSASFWQQILSFGGLLLVCIGTGGIKPCVSAFGANQVAATDTDTAGSRDILSAQESPLEESHANTPSSTTPQQRQVQDFFAYFYFCINVGAVLSIGTIPLAREYYGFVAAFGIPTLVMWGAVFLFWSKRKEYIHQVPSNTLAATMIMCCRLIYQRWCRSDIGQNITLIFRPCQECFMEVRRRMRAVGRTPLPHSMGHPSLVPPHAKYNDDDDDDDDGQNLPSVSSMEETVDCHNVGGSNLLLACDTQGKSRNYGSHHHYPDDDATNDSDAQLIRDAEQALRVLPIMAMFPIFWMLYDQQGSVWTLQATRMRLHGLQPEQLTLVNPIEITIFIPLFQQVVYPFLARRGWNLTPLRRIRIGMVLAAISFFASGLLESTIQRTESTQASGHPKVLPPSVFWQLIQITILAISEILVSVTGLEWAYDTAPHRIKALLMAMFLLTTAVGDLLGGILYSTIFQSWNRATVLHVCASLLLLNRVLFDWVVSQSSLVHGGDNDPSTRPPAMSKGMDGHVPVVSVAETPFRDINGHRHFKELTTRSSSIMGVELPAFQHDLVD